MIDRDQGFLRIEIDRNQLDELINSLLSPAAIQRVQKRAINETISWLRSKVLQQLPDEAHVPRKALNRRFRSEKAHSGNNRNAVLGKLWIGTKPIDAIYLPNLHPLASGYSVGDFYVENAFKAYYKTRTERLGIYERYSEDRTKIGRVKISIKEQANAVINRLILPAEQILKQKTMRLVAWELERAAR